MFKVFAFGFETRNKTISSLIYRLFNEALLVADHISVIRHFSSWTYMCWFLINILLRFGFSRCLQALMHWCGFHAARGESEWCIGLLLWFLAAQTVATRHLSSCCAGDFYFPVHHACTRAPSCCDTRLRTSHQTCSLPTRPHLNPVGYKILIVIRECVHQKQQRTSNVDDELWLLTEWHIIFHKVG